MSFERKTATVPIRVRPLRIAFLVPINDPKALLQASEYNTCLWGSRYNCVIPIFKRLPSNWKERYGRSPSPLQYIEGMLDAFEPDYLVQVDCELPSGIDFPPERIFNIASVFSESDVKLGLDVRDVFADLYEKEFRFKLRHPEKFLIAEPADAQSTLLSAVCFGRFPTSDKPRSTHAVYKYVFSPKVRQIDEKHFLEYFRANHNFPNRIA